MCPSWSFIFVFYLTFIQPDTCIHTISMSLCTSIFTSPVLSCVPPHCSSQCTFLCVSLSTCLSKTSFYYLKPSILVMPWQNFINTFLLNLVTSCWLTSMCIVDMYLSTVLNLLSSLCGEVQSLSLVAGFNDTLHDSKQNPKLLKACFYTVSNQPTRVTFTGVPRHCFCKYQLIH